MSLLQTPEECRSGNEFLMKADIANVKQRMQDYETIYILPCLKSFNEFVESHPCVLTEIVSPGSCQQTVAPVYSVHVRYLLNTGFHS